MNSADRKVCGSEANFLHGQAGADLVVLKFSGVPIASSTFVAMVKPLKFLQSLSVALGILMWGVSGVAAAPDSSRPNVIFILVDDMGWGDLGVFFQNDRTSERKFATPNLDGFAKQGMQLRRHYCAAPVCAPSRASLLLGMHQGHSNIRNNQFDHSLAKNHTLATVMKEAGYATAAIGKWGLQGPGPVTQMPGHPLRRGFDYFYGYMSHLSGHFHYPERFKGKDNQGQALAIFENETDVTEGLANCYSTDLITARAKKWLVDHRSAAKSQPFFLYLAYTAPHAHLEVPTQAYPRGKGIHGGVRFLDTPGRMINTASGGKIDSWIHPDYANQEGWTEAAKRHATMMRRIDDAIADVVMTLRDLKIDEQTLVVFTSDNGPHQEAGVHGQFAADPQFFGSYGPFTGIKRDTLEGGLRVPTLVRWPGKIKAGIDETPSQFQDWMATLADLAGVPVPASSDGVSLIPLLTGREGQQAPTVYTEYFGEDRTPNYPDFGKNQGRPRGEMQAVYLKGFKGLRTNIKSHEDPFMVFDPVKDPAEQTNLAGTAEVPSQADFQSAVIRMRRASRSSVRPYDKAPVPAVSLTAPQPGLGYHRYATDAAWVGNWPKSWGMKPEVQGSLTELNLTEQPFNKASGLLIDGFIKVPEEGEYTFFLTTETGAFVRLHDAQLIDADAGYHGGMEASSEPIVLAAGFHPIRIFSRHTASNDATLEMSWQGPSIEKQTVPTDAWFKPADLPNP